jgi:hypothetical protein
MPKPLLAIPGRLHFAFVAVDVVKRERDIARAREFDQPACGLWRNRLTSLVVTDISLRAPHPLRKCVLREAQSITNRFNGVHSAQIIEALL